MNLTSPSQVKSWCIENGFHPNKTLGQNFLIDRNALEAIVNAGLEKVKVEGQSQEGSACRVLEVGPGMGVLTEEMLKHGCEVVAIEKDPVLAERLVREAQVEIEGGGGQWWENFTVITGDALDVIAQASKKTEPPLSTSTSNLDLSSFSCMISNLPYQAGTRILLEFVERRAFPSMTVLVQTEVAERLAAKEGSKVRGLAGVWTQLDYDVTIVRKVAASCFWPRPEIGSTVVRLDRHDRNLDMDEETRKVFRRLTKQAFEHRRKQLGSIFKDMIQSTARAEELSNEDWKALAQAMKGILK